MGGTRSIARTPFATWLDGELKSRGWGVRTLARNMNGGTPELPRRALYRYLFDGHMPTPMYRRQIAQALGVPESELPDGEDAEPG